MWGGKSRLRLRAREGQGRGSEKGKGNSCRKGKEEIRRAREGVEQKKHKRRPHESTALPEGRLPAWGERSDHKVELHSLEEQRDLVIVRRDPTKDSAHFQTNLNFCKVPKADQQSEFLSKDYWPSAIVWADIFANFAHPLGFENSPKDLVQKCDPFCCLPREVQA